MNKLLVKLSDGTEVSPTLVRLVVIAMTKMAREDRKTAVALFRMIRSGAHLFVGDEAKFLERHKLAENGRVPDEICVIISKSFTKNEVHLPVMSDPYPA